jgi:Zn finger protein HypA/HybF involved in hydrogenase expression
MHDTILLSKISEAVKETCIVNKIIKVNRLEVVVNQRSHVNENNLYEHLGKFNKELFGEWTKIYVSREDDIQDQTAILKSIEGEKCEE